MKANTALALASACLLSLSFLDPIQPATVVSEVEPNNSFATHHLLPFDTQKIDGFLNSGDLDFFTLSALNPGSPFLAEITSGTFDSLLGWLDDFGNIIEIDDDSGAEALSFLGGTVPESGNLNLAVTGFPDFALTSNHAQSGSYTLSLTTFTAIDSSPNPTLINGGFETGNFSGWATLGQTRVETSTFGSEPTEGNYQAFLSTGGNTFSTLFLEAFLGLEVGRLSHLGNGSATEGSAIQQTFMANAGDILTFDWNFLTHESMPTFYNDFSFVSLSFLSEIADTNFPIFASSLTPFTHETGFHTFSFRIPTTGTYRLGIGVTDVEDIFVDSGLLIDNVRIVSVPDPSSTLGLLTVGVLGVGALLKRRLSAGTSNCCEDAARVAETTVRD